ncbi:MAG: hypothetical protein E6I27_07380 [Chloroflexi bacterium]|nr:MAG: hypothetical protein E6I27_07380 [Chloroflexota bacterium]
MRRRDRGRGAGTAHLVPFQVDADDLHRDLVVAVKGKSAFASQQAKASCELGATGFVQSNTRSPPEVSIA